MHNKKLQWTTLVLLMCVLASSVAALGSGRTLYLPFTTADSRAEIPIMPRDLRLDNIAMWDLDSRLIEFGIYDASVRQWVYTTEYNRRNADGAGYGAGEPDSYPGPAPAAEPEMNGALNVNCNSGDGCAVVWKGFGTMRSHFQEELTGWHPWGFPTKCPGAVCTVLSTIAGDTRVNVRRNRWIRFGTSSLGVPVYVGKLCFVVT